MSRVAVAGLLHDDPDTVMRFTNGLPIVTVLGIRDVTAGTTALTDCRGVGRQGTPVRLARTHVLAARYWVIRARCGRCEADCRWVEGVSSRWCGATRSFGCCGRRGGEALGGARQNGEGLHRVVYRTSCAQVVKNPAWYSLPP